MPFTREQALKRATERPALKDGAALVERLARGRDLRKRMTWPGGGLEVELQVLSRAETADAHAAALAACTARGLDGKSMNPRAVEALVDEEYTQILARALRDPTTHELLCQSAAELAAAATDDELVVLFNAYSDLRHAVDPMPDELPDEDLAAIDAAVKKKDERSLSAIVSSMPLPWARSTALRLGTSLMRSSTSTSGSTPSPAIPEAGPAE